MLSTIVALALLAYIIRNPRAVLASLRAAARAGITAVRVYRAITADAREARNAPMRRTFAPRRATPRYSLPTFAPMRRDTVSDVDPYASTHVAADPSDRERATVRDAFPMGARLSYSAARAVVCYLADATVIGRDGRGVNRYDVAPVRALRARFDAGAADAADIAQACALAFKYRGQIERAPAGAFSRYEANA